MQSLPVKKSDEFNPTDSGRSLDSFSAALKVSGTSATLLNKGSSINTFAENSADSGSSKPKQKWARIQAPESSRHPQYSQKTRSSFVLLPKLKDGFVRVYTFSHGPRITMGRLLGVPQSPHMDAHLKKQKTTTKKCKQYLFGETEYLRE
ncbi:hypothetical protein PoB_004134500 [Plakobranchus ocellatus]|uniref:Uncharacterized protein n=1 Tax=Plakobranchus ocellatus TaxID=259542 RepID=A0AAV4B5D3_9GAST|nr:hypothetical protein PoB_004134500 [Plakobranchus ocellatus]